MAGKNVFCLSLLMSACFALCLLLLTGPTLSAQAPPRYKVDPSWPKKLPNNWTFANMHGIAVDKNAGLVVTNVAAHAVDYIRPPYTKVNGTLGSGFDIPTSVHLNRKNTQMLVTDTGHFNVTVVDYQNGADLAVLGTGNGLTFPYAAAEH